MAMPIRENSRILLVAVALLAGCEGLQKKHDSPVLVQAPRRVEKVDQQDSDDAQYAQNDDPTSESMKEKKGQGNDDVKGETGKTVKVASMDERSGTKQDQESSTKEFDGSEIKQVSASSAKDMWDNWKDDTPIFNAQVAATVNGAPILNGDVLDRYSGYLISVREEMQKSTRAPQPGQPMATPEDYEKFRITVIQREIASYIQRKLLVERLKSGLKPEQVKMMEEHVDEMFEKDIDRLKREMKVTNKTELEIALNKKGTTLANVRSTFALDKLSMECMMIKSDKPTPIERPDLVAYYRAHPEKFTFESKVKWQQVLVSVTPALNKKAARKKIEQAVEEINNNVPFDKVAKKYSDGPTAKQGGAWDWMEAGNLKDKSLEKKLFVMPLNQLSEIYEGDDSFCVVRVIDRQEAGRKPFREVQQEIYTILEDEQNRIRPRRLFKELFSRAVIETQYSLPQFYQDE